MTDPLSEQNFKDDLDEVLALPEVSRWTIEHAGPLEAWVTMSALGHEDDLYQARLLWTEYPGQEPPSLKFRDTESGSLSNPEAWPLVRGMRPASLDACANWTLEGFRLHPEWWKDSRYRWDPRGNVLLKMIRILQGEFDETYQGRFKG